MAITGRQIGAWLALYAPTMAAVTLRARAVETAGDQPNGPSQSAIHFPRPLGRVRGVAESTPTDAQEDRWWCIPTTEATTEGDCSYFGDGTPHAFTVFNLTVEFYGVCSVTSGSNSTIEWHFADGTSIDELAKTKLNGEDGSLEFLAEAGTSQRVC